MGGCQFLLFMYVASPIIQTNLAYKTMHIIKILEKNRDITVVSTFKKEPLGGLLVDDGS